MTGKNQVLSQGLISIHSVSLGKDQHIAAFGQLEFYVGERLDMSSFARGDFARTFGDGTRLPKLTRVEGQQAVCLAVVAVTKDDCLHSKGTDFGFRHEEEYTGKSRNWKTNCVPIYLSDWV
jgi:hypothetical protein